MKKTNETTNFVRKFSKMLALATSMLAGVAAFAQPANDDCANAITLSCGQTVSGSTTASTDDGVADCGTTYDGGQGVWYYFSGNDNLVTLTTCDQANFDTKISVYSGSCGSLTCVDGNDDDINCTGNTSTISFVASSGTDYYILIHGFLGATGDFDLTVTCTPPPSNDDCANAIPVACGDVVSGNTAAASADASLTTCIDDLSTAPGVWYSFVGTGNGVTFSLCSNNTDYDTKMGVFSGNCGAVVCEDSNDDECGLASQVTLCSTVNGQTYYVYVTGFGTDAGNFDMLVSCDDGNDDCANAVALPTVYTGLFNNLCATTDGPDEPTGCTFFSYSHLDNDIWYSITPESSCDVTVSLCGSAYDTKMAIYDATGGCPVSESALFCNDDFCSLQSEITFTPTASNTYYIRVSGYNGAQGLGIIDISIDDNSGPVIVNCPADVNQTADAGQCGAAVTIAEPVFGVDYTDDCYATIINDYNGTSDASDTYPVGVTFVTWTVTDLFGNTDFCTQTITVTDDEDPILDCTTSPLVCNTDASTDVGQAIDDPGLPFGDSQTITSTLTIGSSGTITDLNVLGVDITHTWIQDLTIELTSPNGTTVTLFDQGCGADPNMLMSFDDEGLTNGSHPCPPTDGLAYQPDGLLSAFDAEDMMGTWILSITDNFTQLDFGMLNGWSLEICTGGDNTVFVSTDSGACGAAISMPAPAVSDNCGSLTLVNDFNNTNDASDNYPVGTTIVTWTATDTSGNSSTCQMVVTVTDDEDPVIVCPGDTALDNTPGQCGTVFTYADMAVSDNCPLPIIETATFNTPTPIPDGDSLGLSIPFTVSGINGTALGTDVNVGSVCLDVTHTWIGDLIVSLESPNGTVIELINRPGVPADPFGCGGDNIDACFEPGTGNPAEDVCSDLPALGGTFTAVADLSGLDDGSDPNGTWTIFVSDNEGFDAGQLESLAINFLLSTGTPMAVQTAGLPSGSTFPVGITTNTFEITDASGNTSTCSFDVTVNDVEPPVMTCIDVTQPNDAGQCDAVVNYVEPVGIDACDTVNLTQSLDPNVEPFNAITCNAGGLHADNGFLRVYDLATLGYTNDFFVHSVTFGIESAVSNSGNGQPITVNLYTLSGPLAYANLTLVATNTLTIPDTALTLYEFPIVATIPGSSQLVVEVFAPEGQTLGDSFFIGTNSAGQTGASYIAAADCGAIEPTNYVDIGFPNVHLLIDVNAASVTTQIAGLGTGSTFPVGTTAETFVTTDLHGNSDTCSVMVTVVDTAIPVISCPTSTLSCNTTPSTDVGLAIDDPGLPFAESTTVTSELYIGSHGIISDVNLLGLDITHTWTGDLDIQLESPSGTVIDLVQDPCEQATTELLIGFDDSGLTHGTWPCDANDNLAYQPLQALAAFNGEDMFGTWILRITDDFTGLDLGTLNAWNLEICTGGNNLFAGTSDSTLCEGFVSLPAATATDNCPGVIITNSYNGTSDASDSYPVGITTVEWYATDSAGNADTCSIMVFVEDGEDPVVICPGDSTLPNDTGVCGAVYDYNIIATDNCPLPGVTVSETWTGSVAIPDSDPSGVSLPFNVSGLPSTLGVDVLFESICVDLSHTWTGDLIVSLQSPNGVTVELINQIGFPASAFGCSGDDIDACFEVGTGNPAEGVCSNLPALGGTYTAVTDLAAMNDGSDPNGTWTLFVSDNAGGDLGQVNEFTLNFYDPSQSVTQTAGLASGSVFPVGTTYNEFVVVDAFGNSDTCSFNITVNDVEDPIWACIPDTTVDQQISGVCFAIVSWTPPVASDNCGVDTVYSTHSPGDLFPVGVTTVTYTAMDTSGNMSTCSFDVTVLDVEDPLIGGCPADMTVSSDANSCGNNVSWTQPIASDNCSGVALTATHVPGDFFPIGTTTVMYTATDSSGNTATCGFDVTVVDDVAPMITCPADIELCSTDTNGAVVSFATPVGTDNCMVDTVMQIAGFASDSVFPVGTTVVTFVVTDTAGNADTCSFNVVVNPTPEFTVDIVDVDCNGNGNGSLTVNATFGTAPLSYALDNGTPQSSNMFSGLSGGTYVVTVIGDDGCEASQTVTVDEPDALVASVDFEVVLCFGDSTGEIAVSTTGGTAPIEYSIDGGANYQSGAVFSNLPAGTYAVRVRDDNGCTDEVSVDITQPSAGISTAVDVSNVLCTGQSNGSATVTAAGGTGAYQYSSDGVTYQGSNVLTDLGVGTHVIYTMDANGCINTDTITVNEPTDPLFIDAVNATPVNCHGDANGILTVLASGGTAPYQYSIDGGATYQSSSTFNGLAAATYVLSVQDANGCTAGDTVDIDTPAPLALDVTDTSNPNCEGQATGSITVAGSGGTTPYEYSLNGGTPQSSGTFSNIPSGTYTITITDQKGCTVVETVTLDANNPLPDAAFTTVTAAGTVAFNNQTTDATSYSWNFDDGGTSTDENPVHTYTESGVYTVYMIATNNCGSDTAVVTLIINVTGIEEADGSFLNIYPNPTHGEFTIEYQAVDNIGKFEVRVVTIDGKLLHQEADNVVGSSYLKRFDKSEFSTGVYVIEVLTDTGVYHERLIIEK